MCMKKFKKLTVFFNNFSKAFARKNLQDYAASTAFFIFLSLIPFMMVAFAVMPYTFITEDMVIRLVIRIFPEAADSFILGIIEEIYDSSAGIITVSVIVTLWSAGKAMQALIRGLNVVNDFEENRNALVLRAVACVYTIAMLIATVIMIGLLMFGRLIVNFVLKHIPELEPARNWVILLRYPVSLLILVVLFTGIYCLAPRHKQRFKKQLPGAVFSSIVWSVASWLFSFYINKFNGFSTYGSMATIIVVLFYLYMMMYIILLGAYINMWLGRSVSSGDEQSPET